MNFWNTLKKSLLVAAIAIVAILFISGFATSAQAEGRCEKPHNTLEILKKAASPSVTAKYAVLVKTPEGPVLSVVFEHPVASNPYLVVVYDPASYCKRGHGYANKAIAEEEMKAEKFKSLDVNEVMINSNSKGA